MKPLIIYSSYTGTTHQIAVQVHEACGGEIIEVKSWDLMSRFFMFFSRYSPEMQVRNDGIPPGTIDLSGYDPIVIGTSVWMGKPTSAIRKTIAALTGCSGKRVIIFATCGEDPGTTLATLSQEIAAKGMTVAGQFSLDAAGIADGTVQKDLIGRIRELGSNP